MSERPQSPAASREAGARFGVCTWLPVIALELGGVLTPLLHSEPEDDSAERKEGQSDPAGAGAGSGGGRSGCSPRGWAPWLRRRREAGR